MQTEKKILPGEENGFTDSLISFWYLDQGSKKNNKNTTTRQEVVVLIKYRFERFVFGHLLLRASVWWEISDRHVVTKRASLKKVDIESVEGIKSFYFPLSRSPSRSRRSADCLSSATWRSKATLGECAFAVMGMLRYILYLKRLFFILPVVILTICPDLSSTNTPECCHKHETFYMHDFCINRCTNNDWGLTFKLQGVFFF